jgi:hypothetical protein
LRQIRRDCTANGIDVIVVPEMGKGNHRGLVFQDRETGDTLRVVVSGHKEISPGVQRGVVKYLRDRAGPTLLSESVGRILEAIFKS